MYTEEQNNSTRYVGVYGTLRRGFGNHILMDGFLYKGFITITGYAMYTMVYEYSDRHGSVPYITYTGKEEDIVRLEVYSGPPVTSGWGVALRNLDRLEGHPKWYVRKTIEYMGKEVWVYVFPKSLHEEYVEANRSKRVPHGDFETRDSTPTEVRTNPIPDVEPDFATHTCQECGDLCSAAAELCEYCEEHPYYDEEYDEEDIIFEEVA